MSVWLRRSPFLLLGLLAVACSSTELDGASPNSDDDDGPGRSGSGGGFNAGGAGGGGGGGANPTPDWGPSAEPVGSFDVRFLEISPVGNSGLGGDRAPSHGKLLRVDFPTACGAAGVDDDAFDVVPCVLRSDWQGKVLVTAQGGVSSAYSVVREANALVLQTNEDRVYLDGKASPSEGAGGEGGAYFVSDKWSKFIFPLDKRGQVVPPVLAVALQTVAVDEAQPSTATLNGRASFKVDATPPKAALVAGSSFSPPDAQLPWDPLTIRFDEPVAIEPAKAIITTPDGSQAPASLVWRWATSEAAQEMLPAEPLDEEFGATWYRGYWRGWDVSPAQSTVKLGAFRDPRGNVGESLERGLKVVTPPPNSAAEYDFESAADDAKLVVWGGAKATMVTQGCEASGLRCLSLAFDNVECGMAETAGVALRLQAPKGADRASLQLRARVYVGVDDGGVNEGGAGGAGGSGQLNPLSIQIVWAGSAKPQQTEPQLVETNRWGNVTAAIESPSDEPIVEPTNPDDVAVVVRAGGKFATDACQKVPAAPLPTRVLIDSIAIEPAPARLGPAAR
jgi:hypothetical protein